MNLKLNKPICFFDLETTGINITKDRIVEISILKIDPSNTETEKTWLVNPQIPIPKEASDIHGITDDKVAHSPTFKQIAGEVSEMIKNCDLAGFNSNRFDIPLLAEEMLRVGQDFHLKNSKTVDVQAIFHKMEKRTLGAAYKFYCDKELENAHSAKADTIATYEVLKAQLDRYEDLENNMNFLSEFSTHQKFADFAGFIRFDKNNEECFSFGKHKNKKVRDVLQSEPGYFNWILNAEFPLYTKKVLTAIKLEGLC